MDAIRKACRARSDRDEGAIYLAPARLGKAQAPASLILGCGAFGALLGGPLGFGASAWAGKYLTGELKNGALADKVEKALAGDEPPPDV